MNGIDWKNQHVILKNLAEFFVDVEFINFWISYHYGDHKAAVKVDRLDYYYLRYVK